jgi:hypothetical protein
MVNDCFRRRANAENFAGLAAEAAVLAARLDQVLSNNQLISLIFPNWHAPCN